MGKKTSCKDDNSRYSFDDLIRDDHFIASQLHPGSDSATYWNEMLEKGMVNEKDYVFARRLIHSVQISPESLSDAEILNLWMNIEVVNKANMKKKKRRFHIISIVSGMVALIALLLFITGIHPDKTGEKGFSPLFVVESMDKKATDVQLFLDDDKPVSLGGSEVKIAYSEESIAINGNEIILKNEWAADKKQRFHQLVIPYGKRSVLTLPDGSRIWANASTRMAYPVVFDKKKREIYVDGEIYLEVAPDKQRPFMVKTTKMDVEVLGTVFNLRAYEEDETQHIVLVEGGVKIQNIHQEEAIILKPNEMYSYSNGISKIQPVDVEEFISWKNGFCNYDSDFLGDIVKYLSRYYGCTIECSPQASQLRFSGKLFLRDSLETILKGISQTAPISYRNDKGIYKITNK